MLGVGHKQMLYLVYYITENLRLKISDLSLNDRDNFKDRLNLTKVVEWFLDFSACFSR